jgi:phosphoglycerate kinase
MKTLKDADLKGKRVLVRADLNVPMKDGVIQDDTRLQAVLPTLKYLLEQGCDVTVMTHLGRPGGKVVEKLRVKPVSEALNKLLGTEVKMLENTRFNPGEKENDPEFAKKLAGHGDVFVNDAFGTIHRAHASTVGVTEYLPSFAGLLVEKEVEVLSGILKNPAKPICLVIGGAKIDTKIGLLQKFVDMADYFLIGGALANTFLAAKGYQVGKSLYQEDKVDTAREFLMAAEAKSKEVYLPADFVVSEEISSEAVAENVYLDEVEPEMRILDLGNATRKIFVSKIGEAGTIIWNGPMGMHEYPQFADGTKDAAEAIAESDATSVVGGGDSIDAINKFGIDKKKFSHISTGGGAMLEFLEGKELPGLEALK